MAFRPEFSEALSLLGMAMKTLAAQGFELPILVGGAAVEFYTGGAVISGDFDFVTPHQQALNRALAELGFEQPTGPGMLRWSVGLAVQVVSGQLMDGKADRNRIRIVDLEDGQLRIISIEDLIADRMGQAFAQHPPRKDLLDQASKLNLLAEELDDAYLNARILEETLNSADLETLRRHSP